MPRVLAVAVVALALLPCVLALLDDGEASRAASRPPANCTAAMDGYCAGPALRACSAKIKGTGGELPLKAVRDVSASSTAMEWRCYSPSCLTPDGSAYRRGSHCRMGCTRDAELSTILRNCTHPAPVVPGRELRVQAVDIWGEAARDCGMIRTPELVRTPHKLLLFGQCRHANASNPLVAAPEDELTARLGLGDNMLTVKMLSIESSDGGASWSNINTVSSIARSVGVGIYDAKAKAVIFQYQSFTHTNPYAGNALLQRISTDEGSSWGAERDITHFLAACNNGPGGQVCGAAGSKLQSSTGRIIFSGHNKATAGGGVCVWFSDDGGQSYQTNQGGIFTGNEQSIADLGNGSLYMNGRGTSFPFHGNRAAYWSHDDGKSWSAGVEARELREPTGSGCDGSLIAVSNRNPAAKHPPRVFFAEPAGPGERVSLRVWCSVDGGKAWTAYTGINQGDGAGYSALEYVIDGSSGAPFLVVVWEGSVDNHQSTGTMFSHRLAIDDWCPELA
jgi:hypothetical protein